MKPLLPVLILMNGTFVFGSTPAFTDALMRPGMYRLEISTNGQQVPPQTVCKTAKQLEQFTRQPKEIAKSLQQAGDGCDVTGEKLPDVTTVTIACPDGGVVYVTFEPFADSYSLKVKGTRDGIPMDLVTNARRVGPCE